MVRQQWWMMFVVSFAIGKCYDITAIGLSTAGQGEKRLEKEDFLLL